MSFASLCFCTATLAGSQIYGFSGVMTDIRDGGAGITFGTSFVATYTHDDSPQVGTIIEPGRIAFRGGIFSISTGALTLLAAAPTELQVFDNWSSAVGGYNNDDGFFVSGLIYDTNPSSFYLIQFDLWDFEGTTLSSLSVPSQMQFLELANSGRFVVRRFENGIETGLALGALDRVTAIPEPSSILLLCGGIGVIVFARRFQRISA